MLRYTINTQRKTMVAVCGLSLVLADIEKFIDSLRRDSRYVDHMRSLIDLRPLQALHLGLHDIEAIVSRVRNHLQNRKVASRCAIIAFSDLVYGMSRQFQIIMGDSPVAVGVFRDHAQARCWLLRPEKFDSLQLAKVSSQWW